MFLYGVVGEVDEGVVVVLGGVLEGAETQVALTKEINLIVVSEHRPHPDVELSLVYQHGALDVFLDHER